ncbi:hypothetical protein GJ496_002804 [Pomphorhynchus laevis]|nr:hypothetical protein GJ496_002804 [Pomphorhynchus laevis]
MPGEVQLNTTTLRLSAIIAENANVAFHGTKAAGKIIMLKDKETSNTEEKALLVDYAHLFNNNERPKRNYTVPLNVDSAANHVDFGFLEPVDPLKEDVKWATADSLSRLPIKEVNKENVDGKRVHMLLNHDATKIGLSAYELRTASLNNQIIQRVRRYLEGGYANNCEDQLQPYAARKKNEISSKN